MKFADADHLLTVGPGDAVLIWRLHHDAVRAATAEVSAADGQAAVAVAGAEQQSPIWVPEGAGRGHAALPGTWAPSEQHLRSASCFFRQLCAKLGSGSSSMRRNGSSGPVAQEQQHCPQCVCPLSHGLQSQCCRPDAAALPWVPVPPQAPLLGQLPGVPACWRQEPSSAPATPPPGGSSACSSRACSRQRTMLVTCPCQAAQQAVGQAQVVTEGIRVQGCRLLQVCCNCTKADLPHQVAWDSKKAGLPCSVPHQVCVGWCNRFARAWDELPCTTTGD